MTAMRTIAVTVGHRTGPARVVTDLKVDKPVQGQILTAAAMDAHNTFEQPHKLVPAAYTAQPGGSELTLELPPKSIVVVEVPAP